MSFSQTKCSKQSMYNNLNKLKKINQKAKSFKMNLSVSIPKIILKLFLSFLLLITIVFLLNGCNAFNHKNGSLEGEVHRQTLLGTAPLTNALISISGSTNTTSTNQDGYFLLSEVPAGKRTLTIIKEGYITLKLINVYIEPDIVNQVFFGQTIVLQPKEDTALYDTAMEYFSLKYYEQAINKFKELLETFPDSSWADDAQYYSGKVNEIIGDYFEARDGYLALLAKYPNSPWAANAHLGIGNCYYNIGNYDNAKTQYRTVIDNYPLSDLLPFAQYRIAWCDRRRGDYEEAIMGFRYVIEVYPQNGYTPPSHYFIGEIYYDLQYYNKAIDAFQETINNYPLATWPDEKRLIAPAAHFFIGYCYEQQEMWQDAINNYEVIIAQYPGSTWDDGKSIAQQAQSRIDYIREYYLPSEEENSD